jgi:RHS repeat-associated protein
MFTRLNAHPKGYGEMDMKAVHGMAVCRMVMRQMSAKEKKFSSSASNKFDASRRETRRVWQGRSRPIYRTAADQMAMRRITERMKVTITTALKRQYLEEVTMSTHTSPARIEALIAFLIVLTLTQPSAQSQLNIIPEGMNMPSRVPAGTVPASSLDFTGNQDFTGNISLPIPLVSLGGVEVQLKYYSRDIANKVKMENRYAPSGSVGLGWDLVYGSISGEINGSVDTLDDRYFYNGPDGSFELQQGTDGIFRIPNYRPWIIRREKESDGNRIAGWTIIKEDGTILRFGNYTAASGFQVALDATLATRFFLGYQGLVSNPPTGLYDSLQIIPYQWDLSNVQDIAGNQTTINYTQVQLPLVSGSTNSGSHKYTRESHLSQILDNKGNEIYFNYAAMNSNEYDNDYASFGQYLVDTLSLSTIQIKRNGNVSKKIDFSYQQSTISGIAKRFLSAFAFKDKDGNALPSYEFSYYTSASDTIPGSIKSVTNPDGGIVTYTYKTQSLPSVKLDMDSLINPIDYYDDSEQIINDDGMTGKDFTVIRTQDDTVKVYRRGANGWYLDDTFPFKKANRTKVAGDYVIVEPLSPFLFAVKRTPEGWRSFNVDSALINANYPLNPGSVYCIGVGPNYFVVKYNGQWGGSWEAAIVSFSSNKLSIFKCPGGGFLDGVAATYNDCSYAGGGRIVSIRAFCGMNYVVLASQDDNATGTVFSHYQYSPALGQWYTLMYKGDLYVAENAPNEFDLNFAQPHKAYIGKNFVLIALNEANTCGDITLTKLRVYRRDSSSSGLSLVTTERIPYGGAANLIVGDDYYAYTYTGVYPNFPNDLIKIKSWDNQSGIFRDSIDMSIRELFGNSTSYWLRCYQLMEMGNRLVFLCGDAVPDFGGQHFHIGILKHSPKSHQWTLPAELKYDRYVYPNTFGSMLNQNTILEVGTGQNGSGGNFIVKYCHQIQNDVVYTTKIDSISVPNSLLSDLIWQPGDNFLAFALARRNPDRLKINILQTLPNGTLQFEGAPRVPVISQRTTQSGMGEQSVQSYSFGNGVINQSFTPEFGSVTETMPGNNGRITTSYYTSKDSLADDMNYRDLAGIAYRVRQINNTGATVSKEVNDTWRASGIDPINGVFFSRVIKDSTTIDGISTVNLYDHNLTNCQVSKITEDVNATSDLSGSRDRVTEITYAFQFSPAMQAANMLTQVSGKRVKAVTGSDAVLLAQDSTRYRTSSPYLYLSSMTYDGTKWVTTDSIAYRDPSNGNIRARDNVDKVRTTTIYGYNSTLPVATAVNVDTAYVFVDGFGEGSINSCWQIVNIDNNDTHWSIENGMLKEVNDASAVDGEMDRIVYNLETEITGDAVLEFDIRIGDSNNSDLVIAMGGNTWDGVFGGECAVWTAINNETWQTYGTGWNNIITGLVVGKIYHFKIVAKSSAGTADYYVDGTKRLGDAVFKTGTTGIQQIAFENYGYGSITSTWYIDNVRLYPAGALVTSTSYDPLTLQTASVTDAGGTTTYYDYDGFGRLAKTKNTDQTITSQRGYHYSREGNGYDNFNSSDPNYVETATYPQGVSTEGLVGYWRMEGNVYDEVNSINATTINATKSRGYIGGALSFAGLTLTYAYSRYLNDAYKVSRPTVEAWVKMLGTTGNSQTVVCASVGGAWSDGRGYYIDITSAGKARFIAGNASGSWKVAAGNTTLQAGTWYHLAGVYDGWFMRIYVNGVQDGYSSVGAIAISYQDRYNCGPNPSALYFGIQHNANNTDPTYFLDLAAPFHGVIDEVRIYNRALGGDEIFSHCNPPASIAFTDGLGRTLQTQTREGANDLISIIQYDNAGRQYRSWRPYRYAAGHNYDSPDTTHARSVYAIQNPYVETVYESSPLSRVLSTKPAGCTAADEYIDYSYSSLAVGGQPCTYVETRRRVHGSGDYDWAYNRTYTDRLGRVLRTEAGLDFYGYHPETIQSNNCTMRGQPYQTYEPRNLLSTFTYDFLGRVTEKNDPDEGISKYMYDRAGRLRFMVDAVGYGVGDDKILYWKYDALGRVTEKGYFQVMDWGRPPMQDSINSSTYPPSPDKWRKKYYYDLAGKLTTVYTNNDDVGDNEVKEDFTYDKYGNVASKGINVFDYTPTVQTVSYFYDLLGRVTGIKYPNLFYVASYVYDMPGRITQVTGYPGVAVASYSYNEKGEMATEALNAGAQTRTFSYDTKGVLDSISNSLYAETMGTGSLHHGLYASTQTSYGFSTPAHPQPHTYSYSYDIYGRLTKADNNVYNDWDIGATNPTTYDSSGNITRLQRGSTTRNYSYVSGKNIPDTIGTSWIYAADQTGNITSAGSTNTTLTYDPFTQLTMRMVSGGTTANLQYDGRKERVYKEVNGSKTLYIHGLNDYPLTVKTGSTEIVYYYGPTGIVAAMVNGTYYYIHKDHLGSTKIVTNSSGSVECWYEYDAYGKIMDSHISPDLRYLFTGQELEKELSSSSLWNFRAREYDSDPAIFYAPDPAQQGYSRYGYCRNNPISYIDPTGLRDSTVTIPNPRGADYPPIVLIIPTPPPIQPLPVPNPIDVIPSPAPSDVTTVAPVQMVEPKPATISEAPMEMATGTPFSGLGIFVDRIINKIGRYNPDMHPVMRNVILPTIQAYASNPLPMLRGRMFNTIAPRVPVEAFEGPIHHRILQSDVVAGRFYGGLSVNPASNWLTTKNTLNMIQSPADAIRVLNLPPGATATKFKPWIIPKGTEIYMGWVRGGTGVQIWIPNPNALR